MKKQTITLLATSALLLATSPALAEEVVPVDPSVGTETSTEVVAPTDPSTPVETPETPEPAQPTPPSSSEEGSVSPVDPTLPSTEEKEESSSEETTPEATPKEEEKAPEATSEEKKEEDKKEEAAETPKTAEEATEKGVSQEGTISNSTGQKVHALSKEPVVTKDNVTIVSTQDGKVVLSDGTVTTPEAVGARTNPDKTITVTKADGTMVTLPHTGDEGINLLGTIGAGLIGLVGFLFKKKWS